MDDEAEGVIRNSEFGIRNYPSFARGRAAEPLHLMKKQYIKYKNNRFLENAEIAVGINDHPRAIPNSELNSDY